ncbi:hypothetical protein FO519_000545 [Halicephalobus sp. NKZ332]|nr:hypothetical protein FO519_000545 [Halicephalobus sp. NKZ332]
MTEDMGHEKTTNLITKEEPKSKEIIYVFRERTPVINDLENSDEEFGGTGNDHRSKQLTNFDSSETILTTIPSTGYLDTRKRYVCEKEVETRIPVNNASTMAE